MTLWPTEALTPELRAVYAPLAQGQTCSGTGLAETLGISRQAVWKRICALRELGVPVEAQAGQGYRLAQATGLLDAAAIRSAMARQDLEVHVAGIVDSTNTRLLEARASHGQALVAEAQSAGRGRRGKPWRSPPGSGLYLSLAWQFECGLAGLAPLSLVVGMTAAQALRELSGVTVQVKWPNDLLIEGAKLAGCLVELGGAAEGPCRAVVGLGINLYTSAVMTDLDQRWATLEAHLSDQPLPERNQLAAGLLDALAQALEEFEAQGFEPFYRRWPKFDALAGREVDILNVRGPRSTGRALGVDLHGRLLLEQQGRPVAISSGEASIRAR